jgi:hypothetical protein
MECKTARLLTELERSWAPELGESDAADLHRHLADCPDCALHHQAEQRCDQALGQAMRAVAIPAGLRGRLLAGLPRPAWQRRAALRRVLAAAAALLLLAAGWAWWHQPMAIDLADRAAFVNVRPQTADDVDAAFAELGIATRAPRGRGLNFDYNLLTFQDLAVFRGQQRFHLEKRENVPLLVFRQGAAEARVYILDAERFDLSALDQTPHGSGRFTVVGIPADDPRFGYVIEYSGGSLPVFFQVGGLPPA